MNKILSIDKIEFGRTPNGDSIGKYILKNTSGLEVDILTYGGIISALRMIDKGGKQQNIVLGFNTLEKYINDTFYLGAIIGRYSNRIANGKFSIGDKKYSLVVNNGENHLHGGEVGFNKVVWSANVEKFSDSVTLKLTYLSVDMEEGFPGNLMTTIDYTLTNNNELKVAYTSTTDKPTILNLTQHSYFNLSGDYNTSILNHEVVINADSFLSVDENLIPTGDYESVLNTPFDFRKPKPIGSEINLNEEQLKRGGGYDHNWVVNNQNEGLRFVASAYDGESGRFMEVFSDQPGLQFYTANFLEGDFKPRTGFCFETQHFPDSPNQSHFPTVILNPDEVFSSETVFKFSIK